MQNLLARAIILFIAFSVSTSRLHGQTAENERDLNQAETALNENRIDDAEKLLGLTPSGQNGKANSEFLRGKLFQRKRDFSSARQHYLAALGKRPWTYINAWKAYAECEMSRRDWQNAKVEFESILKERSPLESSVEQEILLDLGMCQLASGDRQSAIKSWRKCLLLNDHNCEAHFQLGMIWEADTQIESAIHEFEEVLRLHCKGDSAAAEKHLIQLRKRHVMDNPT